MKKIKNMKYLFAACVAAASVLSWNITTENIRKKGDLYTEYLQKAQYHEEKGAYITAAENYKKALEFDPDNSELLLLAAGSSLMSGNSSDFTDLCRKAMSADPEDTEPYIMMCDYYCDRNEYDTALSTLLSAPQDDVITDMVYQISSVFRDEYRKFEDVRSFRKGYCAVCDDRGRWGMINSGGSFRISCVYDDIGAYDPDEDAVPVCADGEWFFADIEGKRKYVPEEPYEWIGSFSDGLAPFKRKGKYGYTDAEYNETSADYDFAGSFSGGVAAVMKNGKWALIAPDMKNLTEFRFDLIETDDYGFCIQNGNISAEKDGERICIDIHGNRKDLSENYVCGLAPVQKNGKWGYLNERGDIAVDAVYEETLPFSENGSALVKEDGLWHIITLRIKESHSIL